MTDRKDPDEPSFAIDFIDEAKSSHLVCIWGLPSGLSLYFKSGLRVEIRDVVGWLELIEFAHHLTFSS